MHTGILSTISNVSMAFAWYGHLKRVDLPPSVQHLLVKG
jgi:uncharacterized protein (DUF486 family)